MVPLNGWQRDSVLVRGASLPRPVGQIGCGRYSARVEICAPRIFLFLFPYLYRVRLVFLVSRLFLFFLYFSSGIIVADTSKFVIF